MDINFSAQDYHKDEKFRSANYQYKGSEKSGWEIFRNGELYLTLGPGYVLAKTRVCGICSTDIARANLPFPLPQTTGHEFIVEYQSKNYVVEINASHLALHDHESECPYCNNGLDIHCPARLTIGIDRLPGGFSPYVLVPRNSLIALPKKLDEIAGVLLEPFAAALHAVKSASIENGWRIAVVGPRRLGSLILFALSSYRKIENLNIQIDAVIRNTALQQLCEKAGADNIIQASDAVDSTYDVVFDTSGTESGFNLATQLAKKIVHLKSTPGLAVDGIENLTQMVIDELTLLPLRNDNCTFPQMLNGFSVQQQVFVDQTCSDAVIYSLRNKYPHAIVSTGNLLDENNSPELPKNIFRKYDAVLFSSLDQLNVLLSEKMDILRAKGLLIWDLSQQASSTSHLAEAMIKKNIVLQTSRCGSFSKALNFIETDLERFEAFAKIFVSHQFSISELNNAFIVAKNKSCIKALVHHKEIDGK